MPNNNSDSVSNGRRQVAKQQTNANECIREDKRGGEAGWVMRQDDRLQSIGCGCVAQLAERRSLAGELTLSCARPAVNG